jgi:serine/threonine protein kinase/Tfp pilus assembly protein PilF
MALAPGTHLGPYEILSPLGAGGMGEVYRARDTRLGREVALKLLPAEYTRDKDRLRRFEQEARAASSLNHPNIVTIYEIGQIEGAHFISTEFIEGWTLRQQIAEGRRKLLEALDVAVQVASALSAAHAAGIVHRDIKPENVMQRPDGYVKVLDFGLAKLTEKFPRPRPVNPDAPTLVAVDTDPGRVMGTVQYMSPEQARGERVDARTDVFSLGVMLYEMVRGRAPFTGATTSHVIVMILEKDPPPLTKSSAEVPADLQWIVSKALAKERDERYQGIRDMLVDLKRVKQRLEFAAAQGRSAPISVNHWPETSAGQATIPDAEDEIQSVESAIRDAQSASATRSMSSAEYLISEIRRNKRMLLLTLLFFVLTSGAIAYFTRSNSAIDSVAVLPFVNVGADQKLEALSEELTQSLINSLSQLSPKLRVVPRSVVAGYKGREVDPRKVGQELNVRAVITGRIQQQGDMVNIQADLIDVAQISQLWGHNYTKKIADLLLAQEEVSKDIFTNLRLRLSIEEKRQLEAYLLYLKGRNEWRKRTVGGLQQAIEHFQQAIKQDANYAPAYAGLADCYNMLVIYGVRHPKDAFPRAKEAAERALEIDDTLAEAHTSLAFIKFRWEQDWLEAEREFKLAIEHNPRYAAAHQWYSSYLVALGRFDEAIAEAKQTQQLEPLSLITSSHLGYIYYLAGQYDRAIEQCRKLLGMDPNFFPARRYLGLAYEQKGMYREAITELEQAAKLSGSPLIIALLGHAYAAAGQREEAEKKLAELEQLSKQRYISPYMIAGIYAGLNEKERAFAWLERAFEERDVWLMNLKVDPVFVGLHTDARFAELLGRLRLAL